VTGLTSDQEQLRDLKHRYCSCYDAGDLDGLMTLFTSDASCELGVFGHWRGTNEIRSGYERQMRLTGVPGSRMHVVTNPLIRVLDAEAKGEWYLTSYALDSPGQPIGAIGRYHDSYKRHDSSWLIVQTVLEILWMPSRKMEA
jgi:hypothetical protein